MSGYNYIKKPVSMRLSGEALALMDAMIAATKSDHYEKKLYDRTYCVETAVRALAAARGVKLAEPEKPRRR